MPEPKRPKEKPAHPTLKAYRAVMEFGYDNEEAMRGLCYGVGAIYLTLRTINLLLGKD